MPCWKILAQYETESDNLERRTDKDETFEELRPGGSVIEVVFPETEFLGVFESIWRLGNCTYMLTG